LFLIAMTGVVGVQAALSDDTFSPTLVVLLITGATGNLLVMLSLLLHAFRKPYAPLTLMLDLALALGLIIESGGPDSPLLFVSLIPIITTALRYSWVASVVLASLVVAVYWWSAWEYLELTLNSGFLTIVTEGVQYFTSGVVLLLAGGVISRVGAKIKQTLLEERIQREREAQETVDKAHQRVRLIFELASTLSATLNYERVLEAALDVSSAGMREFAVRDEPQIQMILLFGMDQSLYIASSRGLSNHDRRVRLPAEEGVLADALQSAKPVLTYEPADDPELNRVATLRNCHQAIVVPLRAGFESYGAMVMASPEPNPYPPDLQDLLEAVGNQAVMALQNARLYQNLMEDKERLVAVEEDARKKLARDLHDGPTQTIAAIAMRLNYIRLLTQQEPDKAAGELKQLEDLARRTTKEIRQMLFTLRPLILETQGLVAAIKQYILKLSETNSLNVHLDTEDDVDMYMDKETQGALFYIIEEALSNARKHAEADQVWIRIFKRGMSIRVEVEDNGKGFDVASVEEKYAERSSLGMLNLRERAALVGGKTVIQSAPGEGTTISVNVPLQEKEEEVVISEPTG
jgi:signal transduction histidine kinase